MNQDPQNPSPAEPHDSPPPKRKRRWLRRTAIALLVLAVVLIGVIACAPMIAASSFGRSILVSQANKHLNGTVQIDDTSFGWFSGQRIGGIKLFDANKALILEIDRIETGLTLAGAARGDLDLGQTLLDINFTRLQVDPQGNTNLQRAISASSEPETVDGSLPGEATGQTAELPQVSGKVTVKYRGTIEYVEELGGRPISPPLHIEPGEAVVEVKDINSAIENAITLSLRLGEAPAGTIQIAGKVDAIENARIDLEKLSADQSIKVVGVDFSSLTPLLRVARIDGAYTGVMNGQLAVKADGLSSGSAQGSFTIDNASAGGLPQLAGDTLRLGKIQIPIEVSRSVNAAGAAQIKIASLRVDAPQFVAVVAGELDEQSLRNIAAGRQPDAEGWLSTTLSVSDGASLINQLPNAAHLMPGVQVSAAQLSQTFDLTLRKDKVFTKCRLDLQAEGMRDGNKIALAPVGVSLDGTYTPNVDPVQGFRDLALVLTSSFANARGGGVTLDKLDFTGDGDLGKLRAQVAQFIDVGDSDLGGTFKFAAGSSGELAKNNSTVSTSARLEVAGLKIRLPDQPQIAIGRLDLATQASLGTDAQGAIARVDDAKLTLSSGDSAQEKNLDLAATARNVDLNSSTVEQFELTKLSVVSLPRLISQFGAFVPALKENQIEVVDGQVYANVAGSYDGKAQTLTLSKPLALSTPNLTVTRGGAVVLDREKLTAQVLGRIALAGGVTADLSQLSVNSSIVNINKSDVPLQLRLDDSGALTGSGQLKLAADLNKAGAAIRAFGETPAQVRSGRFDGTIDLAGGVGTESTITLDGLIQQLSVAAAAGEAMQNERVAIKATAKTSADLSALTATANVDSSFAKIAVTKADVLLATEQRPVGTYDMVQALSADVGIPDLPKLYALATAFMPASQKPQAQKPEAQKPEASAPDPTEPLQVTSGGATIKLDVTRQGSVTKVNLSDCRISKLRIARGKNDYAFDRNTPISLKLIADVDAAGEQIKSVRVTELSGDLRVATLAMPTPITITDVLSAPKAAGAIEVDGRLDDVTPVLAILQGGEALPYGGAFAVRQQLANSGDSVQLAGTINIDDFAMRDAADGRFKTIEKQIAIKNDLTADLVKSNAQIKSVTLDMPQTNAVSLKLTGGVNDWVSQRNLQDINLDLTYDVAKLWPLVEPMLSPQTQESLRGARFAGAYTEKFTVRGSFPDKPFNEAIKSLAADGQLRVDLIDAAGLTIEKLVIPVNLRDGRAAIAYGDKPKDQRFAPPATCNGGTLNLAGFWVDLAADEPRLYGPKKHRLIHNVSINPALGDTIGKYVNPIFANTERSKGLLDVTVERCEGVALIERWATSESGTARVALSITDLDIANPLGSLMFGKIAGIFNLGGWTRDQTDTFRGEIRDAIITLEDGYTEQELTIALRDDVRVDDPSASGALAGRSMPLNFRGNIRLRDLRQKLRVTLPSELVARFVRISEKDMVKFFPGGVPISLGGTTTSPEVDIGDIARRVPELLLRSRLTGDNSGSDPIDQIGDILGGLRGKKEKERDQEPPRRP